MSIEVLGRDNGKNRVRISPGGFHDITGIVEVSDSDLALVMSGKADFVEIGRSDLTQATHRAVPHDECSEEPEVPVEPIVAPPAVETPIEPVNKQPQRKK